jgi:hypothetical protein
MRLDTSQYPVEDLGKTFAKAGGDRIGKSIRVRPQELRGLFGILIENSIDPALQDLVPMLSIFEHADPFYRRVPSDRPRICRGR